MMDSLLLLFAARISKRQVKRKRIFLGAAAGSLLTCLVIALPIPSAALKMILFHGFVNVFMLKAGLGEGTLCMRGYSCMSVDFCWEAQ